MRSKGEVPVDAQSNDEHPSGEFIVIIILVCSFSVDLIIHAFLSKRIKTRNLPRNDVSLQPLQLINLIIYLRLHLLHHNRSRILTLFGLLNDHSQLMLPALKHW